MGEEGGSGEKKKSGRANIEEHGRREWRVKRQMR